LYLLLEGHIEIVLDFPALVGIGIAAYVSTNIDDLFILMVFFATPRFTSSQIVLGQYLGMGSLMVVSLAGSFVALLLPHSLIGLLGLFPIAIGIKELLELRKKENEDDKMTSKKLQRKKMQMPFLTVATVTFSGGEEIGIYTALFATNNDVVAIITLVSAVMVLTMLWYLLANYLVKRSSLADRFRRIGDRILSFVLIGLGIYILAETFVIV
jgi:cadmium resistance protein CadD (predicted permease)